MTREQAIESMEYAKERAEVIREQGQSEYWAQEINWTIEAIDMAIEALSAEAVPRSEQYKKGFGDAKRAFLVEYARESENMRKRNAQLEVMLNAQKAISVDRPRDGDLISRAEAIEAIEIVDWYHQNSNKDMVHGANDDEHQAWYKADDVYKALEAVPSAVRPRGYWKDGKWCSVCGMPIATDVWGTSVDESEVHYCIECGAEMRGETNE